MSEIDTNKPFLRTLAPLLRGLHDQLRRWLNGPMHYPVSIVQRAEVEGITVDLSRKAEALDVEQPHLVIMVMGGTGVGKSTLMNALAGASIAQASFTRPTTRDPVVYIHNTLKPERLDPALRLCRFVTHDRESLMHKVIVDTPDVDSNDLENREKLLQLLPVADVVLYVGSQEKYHDQLVWDLFRQQRQRRAFAFVLNKWDRCQDAGAGLSPDQDLLRDLHSEGFTNPKLFRTTAQLWVDANAAQQPVPADLPPGEQFQELVAWLEAGLTRLEIEALKARGVGQLITQAAQAITAVKPPDLSVQAARVRTRWAELLKAEATTHAEVLIGTLEPYQQEVEQHFALRGQQNFWGLTAAYLRASTKLKYLTTSLRNRLPMVARGAKSRDTGSEWDVAEFVEACTRTAGERVLTQRLAALSNKLIVEADQVGLPVSLLSETTQDTGKLDWEQRFAHDLMETLTEIEKEITQPTGGRRWLRGGITVFANVFPPVVLLSSIALVLYQLFVNTEPPTLLMALLPVYATLAALVFVHVLIAVALPVRWSAIREQFQERLTEKVGEELESTFLPIPDAVASKVREARREVESLHREAQQIMDWLHTREQAANIAELYGNPK
jgi:energy-coupling factor transporter ATP-binding protein EcfA2